MSYEHDFKCVTTAIQCTFKRTLIYVHTTFQKILIAIFRQGGTLIFPYHDNMMFLFPWLDWGIDISDFEKIDCLGHGRFLGVPSPWAD